MSKEESQLLPILLIFTMETEEEAEIEASVAHFFVGMRDMHTSKNMKALSMIRFSFFSAETLNDYCSTDSQKASENGKAL